MIKSAKQKVVMVNQPWNPALPPVQSGSVAIWIYETARRITDHYEVITVAPRVNGAPDDAMHDGVRHLRLPTWPEPDSLTNRLLELASPRSRNTPAFVRPTYYARYARSVGAVVARQKPAIVHIHNLLQIAPAVRAAYRDAQIVLHMHCDWLVQLPQEVVDRCLVAVDYVVGCSEYIGHAASERYPALLGRTGALYNGVDLAGFSGVGPATEPVVLWVGRISPEKGLHTLIDAFAQVATHVPDAQLKIAGPHALTSREFLVDISHDERVRELASFYEASYLETLQAQIPASCRDSVHFLGSMPHEELPELYRQARVVANPSFSESFGMSLIEAMA
ncbi:MAG: glycosyltransferase family 4 protein, partial [Candidatus Tectomicrobia bacterium]|nr:glycosyltransferase family 4 protein [Candidatus Tectomicrobia bacterium]